MAFLGRAGTDGQGDFLREALGRDGADIGHLITTPGPSRVALITVGPEGDSSIIVSSGANGAVVADGTDVVHVASPRVEAVDTTGAGDAFTGALSLRLARGDDLAAARFAARVGAAAVRRPGAQSSFPRPEDLKDV